MATVETDSGAGEGLEVSSRSRAGARFITARGCLDMVTSTALRGEFERARRGTATTLVIDLRELAFMDCSGVRLLLDLATAAADSRQRLQIVSPPPRVARIFTLTGTGGLLPLVEAGPH